MPINPVLPRSTAMLPHNVIYKKPKSLEGKQCPLTTTGKKKNVTEDGKRLLRKLFFLSSK